tara:strand:- start:6584 stop:7855 length:1272 start_codon:yes stop_codon:yes gene_type:complete
MTILKAENISKQYRLGTVGTGTLGDDLKRWWYVVRGKEDPFLQVGAVNNRSENANEDYVWALRNINFEVKQGEILGIIGKNGAGKSTLLKILSRVTSPSTGSIKTRGRIASLLEVGTGFHGELTGRENIYMNGTVLGMSKAEITRKLDEIIDFSGCEKYIDTPVKRYSSGMTVRLGFAVAAHLEPEILVVDEVLAVGDAEFQKKAIGKMQDLSKGQGRTVIFVSHNMDSISTLTNRVIVLKNGGLQFDGDTDSGIREYLRNGELEEIYTYNEAIFSPKIQKISVKTSLPGNVHEFGKNLKFYFLVNLPISVDNLALSFQILDEFQNPITHNWLIDSEKNDTKRAGVYKIICSIKKPKLYMGIYSLGVHLSNSKTKEKFHHLESVCTFKIEMMKTTRSDYKWEKGTCKYIEDSDWEVTRQNDDD